MNIDAAIRNGRTVKQFDPAYTITQKTREKMLSSMLQFPAAFHVRNWHFVVIEDEEQRKRIRKASWNRKQITDASMLVILCADLNAWRKESLHYWKSVQEPFGDVILPTMREPFSGLDPLQRDEAMRSCGIAAQTLMLVARSMGYDACPIEGFDHDAVAETINLPEDHAVCMFVAIGKSIDETEPAEKRPPIDEIVIQEHF
jgi:nitroreductase